MNVLSSDKRKDWEALLEVSFLLLFLFIRVEYNVTNRNRSVLANPTMVFSYLLMNDLNSYHTTIPLSLFHVIVECKQCNTEVSDRNDY